MITPSRQRNAVSEGLALGLLMNDCNTIDFPDVHITTVELSFAGAWREWRYRDRFPRVSSDLRNGSNEWIVMTHADEAKRTYLYYWDDLTIYARNDWALEDPPETLAPRIGGEVPAEGWSDLAKALLGGLLPDDPTTRPGQL